MACPGSLRAIGGSERRATTMRQLLAGLCILLVMITGRGAVHSKFISQHRTRRELLEANQIYKAERFLAKYLEGGERILLDQYYELRNTGA